MKKLIDAIRTFAHDEEGAQVIEYALIIAVISIILVISLRGMNGGFSSFISRITTCLTTNNCV